MEKFPTHVVLLPGIINTFNTMARAKMLKGFIEKFPVAGRYLKLTYGNDPRLIQGFNKMDLFNETGAAQGCNLGSMLFAVAYNEVLEEARAFAKSKDVKGLETLIAALADDTTLVGELRTVVHLFLLIQKLAKQKYNLDFHRKKCAAYSPSRTAEALHKELERVQEEIIAEDQSLAPFAFISSCKSEVIAVTEFITNNWCGWFYKLRI